MITAWWVNSQTRSCSKPCRRSDQRQTAPAGPRRPSFSPHERLVVELADLRRAARPRRRNRLTDPRTRQAVEPGRGRAPAAARRPPVGGRSRRPCPEPWLPLGRRGTRRPGSVARPLPASPRGPPARPPVRGRSPRGLDIGITHRQVEPLRVPAVALPRPRGSPRSRHDAPARSTQDLGPVSADPGSRPHLALDDDAARRTRLSGAPCLATRPPAGAPRSVPHPVLCDEGESAQRLAVAHLDHRRTARARARAVPDRRRGPREISTEGVRARGTERDGDLRLSRPASPGPAAGGVGPGLALEHLGVVAERRAATPRRSGGAWTPARATRCSTSRIRVAPTTHAG